MLGINGDYSAVHIKDKIWRFLVNSRTKSALKLFIEKLFYLISWICLQPFVQDCLKKQVFISS